MCFTLTVGNLSVAMLVHRISLMQLSKIEKPVNLCSSFPANVVEVTGFEPMASCVQGRRSPN